MANALYDLGREAFLGPATGQVNWINDTIKAVLVDTGAYTVNLATHDHLDDIPVGARISTSPALASKTVTAGVANAASVVFTAVPAGGGSAAVLEAIVLYKDTGVASTSRLIAYIDTATGLPVTPNGGDITVSWDTGTNKIFKL